MEKDPFKEYLRESEPDKAGKGYAWSTAIGLQAVDGLKPSKYLIDAAIQNIEGKITMKEAQSLIDSYYEERPVHLSDDDRTEEADKVSSRIAEILSLCGMVERSGQGMNLMFELSVQEAKPLPDFTGTDDFFVSVTLNGLIIDKAMLSVINRISERGAELLSTEDFLVIDALYHERPLSEKMQSRLNRLIEMGIVEHIGRKKYVLARSLYAATGKTGVHTRHVGLDRDTNKELLLKHIRQNNEVGTPFKELQQVLPGLDRNQIRVLMRELRESGKVFCEGTTSAARWFASK